MPQRPGFIVRIIAIIALIFTAGLGGTALKEMAGPWAQNILHLSIAALLIWAIVRPRSQTVNWKKQVSIGVALIAGLFTTIYFFGPTGSVGADGRALVSGWSILIAIVGLAAIWIGLSIRFGDPSSPGDILGSARFGNHADVDALAQSDGNLIIGRSGDGKLLRYDGPAHLLTIAPTRSGKGIGTIIPNLLTADRSIICIDPKGENAAITARARSTLGKVWCLDPLGASQNLVVNVR